MRQTLREYIEGRMTLGSIGLFIIGMFFVFFTIYLFVKDFIENWVIIVIVSASCIGLLALFYFCLYLYVKNKKLQPVKNAQKKYNQFKRNHGINNPNTLSALNELALAYCRVENFEKALEVEKEAYCKQCDILGINHVDTIRSMNNLAAIYSKINNFDDAICLFEKAYQLRCDELGNNHESTLFAARNIGMTYFNHAVYCENKKEYDAAEKLFEKAFQFRLEKFGREDKDTIDTLFAMNILGVELINQNENEKALSLHRKIYELRCKILGNNHQHTLTSLSNMAVSYYKLGKHKKALELHEKVYEQRCTLLGKEHSDTKLSYRELTNTRKKLGL